MLMGIDEFWSVEVGVRMGPLVLGTEYASIRDVLRDHRIDVDRMTLDGSGKLSVPEIQTVLVFSRSNPQLLERIDVTDDRLRFGSLSVIGKRVHEIVGIFKLPRKETLWCSDGTTDEIWHPVSPKEQTAHSRDLLARGTLWIPSLGLGMTLRDGLVSTVHLCDPAHSPRTGTGSWTKEQQLLSEVRELPVASMAATVRKRRGCLGPMLLVVAPLGVLIWWGIKLQGR